MNCGNKFDPFRVAIKPPFLGVVIDFKNLTILLGVDLPVHYSFTDNTKLNFPQPLFKKLRNDDENIDDS